MESKSVDGTLRLLFQKAWTDAVLTDGFIVQIVS